MGSPSLVTKEIAAPNKVIMMPADISRKMTPIVWPRGVTGVRSP